MITRRTPRICSRGAVLSGLRPIVVPSRGHDSAGVLLNVALRTLTPTPPILRLDHTVAVTSRISHMVVEVMRGRSIPTLLGHIVRQLIVHAEIVSAAATTASRAILASVPSAPRTVVMVTFILSRALRVVSARMSVASWLVEIARMEVGCLLLVHTLRVVGAGVIAGALLNVATWMNVHAWLGVATALIM